MRSDINKHIERIDSLEAQAKLDNERLICLKSQMVDMDRSIAHQAAEISSLKTLFLSLSDLVVLMEEKLNSPKIQKKRSAKKKYAKTDKNLEQ